MSTPFSAIIQSPLGSIGLSLHQDKLASLRVLPETVRSKKPEDAYGQHVVAELMAYFKDPAHSFDLDFHLEGSPFQQKVWRALYKIPSGRTVSYGELAKKLQTGPRAIGQACRTNPVGIIIPCHRVVAAGHLGGYSGATSGSSMDIKKWLLRHEGCI